MHAVLLSFGISWKYSSEQKTMTENDSCVLSPSQFCWDKSKVETQGKQTVMITERFGTTAGLRSRCNFPIFQ